MVTKKTLLSQVVNSTCEPPMLSPAPVITAATEYNIVSATASVTLLGMNFAPTDTTLTSALASADCATSSWTTQTSAACIGVRGTSQVATSSMSVAGIIGSSSAAFSFDGEEQMVVQNPRL